MPTVIVEVMPKPEILDPQGKAVQGVLARTGHEHVAGVRIGKRFEIELDGSATDERVAEIRELATDVLSNPVIEDVLSVRVLEDEPRAGAAE